ncbi:glycosyltransferase family 2 protein [Bradyrhizobium yuanmingense]|uniref:glycosyltransferase family 2 protein n=1 Tax=Bradyrhizobium yuanmingense TaxID=108015 RepID=UPI0023B9AE62|nr:glycosyltransferase family A protein [Bradyrhizobium yuanmingense]MDF0494648.1 glycosyltransferase family A protein [Bradyrhizobium yuanmingense]
MSPSELSNGRSGLARNGCAASSIDAIIPCYQYGHFLKECAESVLRQCGPELRVLIIDDASTDTTAQVAEDLVRADPRVEFRRHSVNRGHVATFNEGIAWVAADYMILLSADDYLMPGAIERASKLMDEHPSVVLTFGGAIALYEGREEVVPPPPELGSGTKILSGRDFIKMGGSRNIVLAPSVIVRTSLQKKLGGYLPDLTHTGDMEMWLRFAAHGYIGFIDAIQAVYRRHSTNMSGGYSAEQDVLQRKLALEHFLDGCAGMLPDVDDLRSWLTSHLALDTVSCASRAFNDGDLELSERLSAIASNLDPEVTRSRRWWLLACKRQLGLRGWQLLRPAIQRLRMP